MAAIIKDKTNIKIKNIETLESSTGSNKLSGAAAAANYTLTSKQIIKNETKDVGREYVRHSLQSSIKNNLIKNSSSQGNSNVAITENERAIQRANALKGSNDVNNGFVTTVNSISQGKMNESLSESTTTETSKHIKKTPKYALKVGKVATKTGKNVRYVSKVVKDISSNKLSLKEVKLLALKRGGRTLKDAGKATGKVTRDVLLKQISEFQGSDDLGIQAIIKPKDAIIRANTALRSTRRVTRIVKKSSKNSIKAMQKTARKAKQAARYTVNGVKTIIKGLMNPIVLKSIAVFVAISLVILTLAASVAAVASIFSSTTYTSSDYDLTEVSKYVTLLDTELERRIKEIPTKEEYKDINKFDINILPPKTDVLQITSYLTVKYGDFRYDDAKVEIDNLYANMYKLNFDRSVENVPKTTTTTNQDGSTTTTTTNEKVKHLKVTLAYPSFNAYLTANKDKLLPKSDDYEQYNTFNDVGGITLRVELGSPFLGKKATISKRFGHGLSLVDGKEEFHNGIDITMPAGTIINASIGGKASITVDAKLGKCVVITDGDRKTTYGHCGKVLVKDGQTVTKGDEIATVGTSGESEGEYLHFQFEKDNNILDPIFFIERDQFDLTGLSENGTNYGPSGDALNDKQFAAIIAEAEKYLGYPYVFGGKSPSTSFDCSGFVSWVYTHAGVKKISENAQGLYNNCTRVSAAEVKPGDLIFFQGTYDTPNTVTHVAIYVGEGRMLHCGNPIQYTTYQTSYWQKHFYAFGRFK